MIMGMTTLADLWPPYRLRLRAGDLQLTVISDDDVPGLVELALAGIHAPDAMPFSTPWTLAGPEKLPIDMVRYFSSVRPGLARRQPQGRLPPERRRPAEAARWRDGVEPEAGPHPGRAPSRGSPGGHRRGRPAQLPRTGRTVTPGVTSQPLTPLTRVPVTWSAMVRDALTGTTLAEHAAGAGVRGAGRVGTRSGPSRRRVGRDAQRRAAPPRGGRRLTAPP